MVCTPVVRSISVCYRLPLIPVEEDFPERLRAIADEVVVMKDGLIVEAGPKDEMFTPPLHAYTDLLLSSVPEMNPDWLDELLAQRGAENLGDAAVSKM